MLYKNKLPSLFKFKKEVPSVFALFFSTFFWMSEITLLRSSAGALKSSIKKLAQEESYFYKKSSCSNPSEEFIKWFVGFSDAESNFSIVSYKDKAGKIISFTFRFLIELHVDDIDALKLIKNELNLGNDIVIYGNSCKFTVTHRKDIYKLITIFDKYNLNTNKYLDYLDFKEAFNLYLGRDNTIKEKQTLIDQILSCGAPQEL